MQLEEDMERIMEHGMDSFHSPEKKVHKEKLANRSQQS